MAETWMEQTYDQGTVESFGPAFPFAYWVNGDKKLKQIGGVPYTGGWFLPADQVEDRLNADGLPGPGWTAGTQEFRNGQSQDGFYARNVSIAVLVWRKRWIVNDIRGGFAWKEYEKAKVEGNPRGHLQVLGVFHGMEEYGPLVLSSKGMVSKAITDNAFAAFNRYVIAEAARLKRAKPPFRMFWLTVGPEMDGDNPRFTTVGTGSETSIITLPCAVGLTAKLDKAALGKRYVGNELFGRLNELRVDADVLAWATAWDTTNLAEPDPESALAAVDDPDLPF